MNSSKPNWSITLDSLLGNLDSESYFTSTERSRIVNEILARTTYGDRRKGEVGIERLLKEGVYTASYPLHEVICVLRLWVLKCNNMLAIITILGLFSSKGKWKWRSREVESSPDFTRILGTLVQVVQVSATG